MDNMENKDSNQPIEDVSAQTSEPAVTAEPAPAAEGDGQDGTDSVDSVYEAQDVSPSAIRRGRLVVGVMLLLGALAILVVVLMPPLSWKPPKKMKQNFEPISVVESVEQGASDARVSLAYDTHEMSYAIELDQDTHYPDDKVMHIHLDGLLDLNRPKRGDLSETLGIRLKDSVFVSVKDGDREIELGELGEMLKGVTLYARLDAHDGMGRAVPDSDINPQVARVMYIVADALRYMWLALPGESVGVGAKWRLSDVEDSSGMYIRRAETQLTEVNESRFGNRIKTETAIELIERRDGNSVVIGSGKVVVTFKEGGIIERGKLTLTRQGGGDASGAQSQEIRFSLDLK